MTVFGKTFSFLSYSVQFNLNYCMRVIFFFERDVWWWLEKCTRTEMWTPMWQYWERPFLLWAKPCVFFGFWKEIIKSQVTVYEEIFCWRDFFWRNDVYIYIYILDKRWLTRRWQCLKRCVSLWVADWWHEKIRIRFWHREDNMAHPMFSCENKVSNHVQGGEDS